MAASPRTPFYVFKSLNYVFFFIVIKQRKCQFPQTSPAWFLCSFLFVSWFWRPFYFVIPQRFTHTLPSESGLSDVAGDVADLFYSALPVTLWTQCFLLFYSSHDWLGSADKHSAQLPTSNVPCVNRIKEFPKGLSVSPVQRLPLVLCGGGGGYGSDVCVFVWRSLAEAV